MFDNFGHMRELGRRAGHERQTQQKNQNISRNSPRLEAARRQLERTERTVDQIAENCGFRSTAVMRRAFNRLLGTTPVQYRRDLRVPEIIRSRTVSF